jgi:hypothetical protein
MRYVDGCELTRQFLEVPLKRNVFFYNRHFICKIVLPVRFAEVKAEAAKPTDPEKQNSTPPGDT